MATKPDQKPSIAPVVGPDDPRRFTDSGIEIKHAYDESDVAPGLEERLGEPGDYPYTRGIHPDMYRGRQWTMRQYAGLRHRRRDQPALPLPDRARVDRALDGLRPAHPARPRLRRPALHGRGGPHRRGHRHDRRHAPGVRPDPAGRRLDLDDDQRPGRRAAAPLRARRRGAGRAGRAAARHHPERHPQGVHRARELHLPARARDAPDHRPVRLLPRARAEVEHDLDLRLPHAREGLLGGAGGRASRSPTRLRTCRRPSTRVSRSTSSGRGSPSSSTATTTSSRRWRSSARSGGCGRASCASASAPRTSAR